MKDFNDVIDRLGGSKAVSQILGTTINHIETMKVRRSIAPYHWPALVAAAEKQGIKTVTFKRLAVLHKTRFEKKTGEAA